MQTNANPSESTSSGRPYRSHRRPACLPCRKRKSACKIRDSNTCILCVAHGTNCIFPQAESRPQRKHAASPRRLVPKARHAQIAQHREDLTSRPLPTPQVVPPSPTETATGPRLTRSNATSSQALHPEDGFSNLMGVADTGDDSSHIVSPAVADDTDVLESYLSTVPDARRRCLIRTSSSSSRRIRPVLFNTVLRRPLGVHSNQSLPAMKLELIEKYLEPATRDVVDLFFEYANTSFPVFDEASFLNVYSTHKEKISPALLCNLYANSLIYWNNSPKLRSIRSPDIRYIWNQANEALHSELFLSPGISTVMAMLLNVCGRPSTSIFGNGGMVGTAVALSNALGLNRDPSNWTISPLEKRFRIRIWWLIVIHDRWCSLAYGTPLQIHRPQYDVPIPTISDLCPSSSTSPSHHAAAHIFIALTTLTELLTLYLEHIYHVSTTTPTPPPHNLYSLLTTWESSLPSPTRPIILRGTHLTTPGAANLRLAYLAVKLLLCRIELDLNTNHTSPESRNDDIPSPSLEEKSAHRAAEDIVLFVHELDAPQLIGFWLPGLANSITSAVMFLVRCALRDKKMGGVPHPDTSPTGNSPFKLVRDTISTLRSHRDQFGWDLADDCLAKCGDLVEKVGVGVFNDDDDAGGVEMDDTLQIFDVDVDIGIGVGMDPMVWDELFIGIGSPFAGLGLGEMG
ncbi:hypothetical protein BO78DRAFT_376485 [Aspergillus sclerotiicarbonarius CBS 121057]|uniref:Zn(2)-C6 fungal-type domain-containing protein n=1 Tax=Aspergillus sclerotiicarbonarius (strain CBS 121057 / IBT 28362) TaxID=1448318 RepID=A0A319DY38_ASPSB|nr:hypothetical protein BO78DRAFT_376485 [Aspergillus sclerotiicarbonarius CBS 121057]